MQKLQTARFLMVLCVLVITCFQVYWVVTLYRDKENALKKNMDIVFRETLYQLQVKRFRADSVFAGLPGGNLFMADMAAMLHKRMEDTASSAQGAKKNFFISIDTKVDTVNSKGTLYRDFLHRENIIIRRADKVPPFMRSLKDSAQLYDSIPLVLIDSAYQRQLADASIALPFSISKINLSHDTAGCGAAYCTGIVPIGIFGLIGYRASFGAINNLVLKGIGMQLVLSALLVTLTVVSFLFIYRNLLAQRRLAIIKNDFISNITHELKTPIATVNVAIESLRNFGGLQDAVRTREYLDISAAELQRLGLLVDKVLKISMLEKNEIRLEKEKFDLVKVTAGVMSSMQLQFQQQHAQASLETSGGNFIVDADKLHMTSVIYNLLDNALKYSKAPPQITVRVVDRKQFIELSVSDNGIGIPAEYQSKIFEQFFRVPDGDQHNTKGYGLGLSYVNHILRRHHGFIEVSSEPGVGSTFTVKMPFEEAAVIYYDNDRQVKRKGKKI
jgi:two-component system, OmpR family, phosphate regulon sensor histidine kinase PhoR